MNNPQPLSTSPIQSSTVGGLHDGSTNIEKGKLHHSEVNGSHQKASPKKNPLRLALIICKFFMTVLVWMLAMSLFGFYIYTSVHEYLIALPVTSISFTKKESIDYPAITICNFNTLYNCDTCGISLMKTTGVNTTTGMMENVSVANQYKEILYKGGLYRCYVFNNQTESFNATTSIGFSSTFSMFFKIPQMPLDRNNRNGIQISFHEPGTTPDLYGETNYAVEGIDNMYILTKIRTLKLQPSKEYPKLDSVRWAYKTTAIDLTRKESGMIVISVSYATLDETKNKEVATSTLEKLLGEIAGVLASLMGLDGLKIFNALIESGYSIKHKSLMNVWMIFNKGRWF